MHVLDKIKCDKEGTHDHLQKMLLEWLKQADPLPTWKELAEAMEAVDTIEANFKELKAWSADLHCSYDSKNLYACTNSESWRNTVIMD